MEIPKHRAIVIFYLAIVGSAYISIKLFVEGRSYPGTGWAIITCVLVFFVGLERYWRYREVKLAGHIEGVNKAVVSSNGEYMDSLDVLISTKDPVKVHAVANLLREHDIAYSVLDCHMSHMLPNVEIRVMVRGRDMERSIKLVESIEPDA